MGRKIVILIAVLVSALVACCVQNHVQSSVQNLVQNTGKPNGLRIAVPFSKFPRKYTCDGEDVSPPITVENVSSKARSIAILMIDIDAPKGCFVHWVAWDIPANVSRIPENIPKKPVVNKPVHVVQGRNDFGYIGYGGPCPPSGTHRYVINVYTLNCWLSLKPGSTANALINAMKGHVLQHAEVVVTYSR